MRKTENETGFNREGVRLMIPKKYYIPLFVLIVGMLGVYMTGTPAERYLVNVVLGVGLMVVAYLGDD